VGIEGSNPFCPYALSENFASENLKAASIILKNLAGRITTEDDALHLSRQFIGLIKSFSFDCKSRPNRITAFPHKLGKVVGKWPDIGLNHLR
jgi:hypothetical protein